MNGLILHAKLDELRGRLRELQQRRAMARLLGATAALAAAAAWTGVLSGWSTLRLLAVFGTFVIVGGVIAILRSRRTNWTDLELARMIEEKHPDLNALLLTAVEQLDNKEGDDLFKQRLMEDAVESGVRNRWAAAVAAAPTHRINRLLGLSALLCLLGLAALIATAWRQTPSPWAGQTKSAQGAVLTATITPGDTEVEREGRLTVEARFDKDVPADATLVVSDTAGGKERERIAMRLTVDQQVFGGLIPRVDKDALYHVEFDGSRSQDYRITTYQFPALVQADVSIKSPAYSGLPVKEIKNTLRVSALQGSELSFSFKINKAVKQARLVAEDKTVVTLALAANDPTVLTGRLAASQTQKWQLHLVDANGRANKNPPWIIVTALANQLAKIEVMFPKRDLEVSTLQELPIEAKVWDDIGVTKSGAVFNIAGKTKEVVFNHGVTAPGKKEDVSAELKLEQEKVSPKQLVSYYVWAEDKGAEGEVRRAMSDMFFAEVRNFEDIYREAEAPPGEPPPQAGQLDKLLDLQKQVINATWRVIRDTQAGKSLETVAADVKVVQQSEEIALAQTKDAMEKATDTQVKGALTEAWKNMRDAITPLAQTQAEKKAAPLSQALAFEQSALEWLHQAQGREKLVMRQSKPVKGAGKQANQKQLMNLELKQKDQRYEEEKKASAEETVEQQENLQVLNQLKELARRQEALAEKMKALKNQLAKAKTPEERSELDNQLKHLQDEQEQLLRDLDDLKERMEKPENVAGMSEAKEQLEKTREKVLDTAEKLKQQKLADASNSATRAQRDLEKMQEDFKQKTAKRFSEEMKQLRAQAREAAERQKQIDENLEKQKTPPAGNDTSAALQKALEGTDLAQQFQEQSAQVKELMEQMRRISEQAEGNNPLLHRMLYEAVRQAQTGGLEQNLQKASEQSRAGLTSDVQDTAHKASAAVDDLKKSVDKAAESVLGSEKEALQMAKAELDKLIMEAQKENRGPQFEMKERSAESTPPEKAEMAVAKANAGNPPPDQMPEFAPQPPQNPDEEPKDGKSRPKSDPKNNSTSESKSGGYKPGAQPGNPGKSKDMFPTYGPSPKAGKRDGGGLSQNKPADGGPQPPGEGIQDPKDLPKKSTPPAAPAANAPQFPKAPQQLPMEPNVAIAQMPPPSQPASSASSPNSGGQKAGQNKPPSGSGGQASAESPMPQQQRQSAAGQNATSDSPANDAGKPGDALSPKGTPPRNKVAEGSGTGVGSSGMFFDAAGTDGTTAQQAKDSLKRLSQSDSASDEGQKSGMGESGKRPAANDGNKPGGNPVHNEATEGQKTAGGNEGGRGNNTMFFDAAEEHGNTSALTGTAYGEWSGRLRNVEDLLSVPELRNEAAKVLDQARAMRKDFEYNRETPGMQAQHLQLRIIQPLMELRDRVTEELAKRDTDNPNVPMDRDAVPPAFRELVRRYYTELGAGK